MFGLFKKANVAQHDVLVALTDETADMAATVLNAAELRRVWTLHDNPLRPRTVGPLLCFGLWRHCPYDSRGVEVRTGYGTTAHAALQALLTAVDPFCDYHKPFPQITNVNRKSEEEVSHLVAAMQNSTQETRSLPGSTIRPS